MKFDKQLFQNLLFEAEQEAEKMDQSQVQYQDPTQDQQMTPDMQTMPPSQDPSMAMGGAIDPMTGMPMDPYSSNYDKMNPDNIEELSRRFELSKIYKRLIELDTVLTLVTERPLLDTRLYIREALTLFKSMIFNIDLFKDKLDKIIVNYYKFLDGTYKYVKEFYKAKSESEKTENDRMVERRIEKLASLPSPNDLTANSLYF